MSGRRSYPRFRTLAAWAGKMRVSRDVAVDISAVAGELMVVSDAPGVVDEELTLGLVGNGGQTDVRVRVLDSSPQIVDGVVRHRLRLLMLRAE